MTAPWRATKEEFAMSMTTQLLLGPALASGAALLGVGLTACRNHAPRAAQVVFVCEHGAAKSVVAAAHFNRLARERGLSFHAVAKAAEPQEDVAPSAVRGLAAEGLEALPKKPERVTSAELSHASRVVSFGCDLSSAAPKGIAVESWAD